MHISLVLGVILDKIAQFLVGFLAFIPQFIYFLFASIASLLDVLQYLIRKLAGLDVYYVESPNGGQVAESGDILTKFLKGVLGIEGGTEYSALRTVFYSLIIFGLILLVLSTIVAFVKSHYNYDANKANPGKILGSALKTLATMVIVPIVTIFGVYILNALLGAVDAITSPASSSVLGKTFTDEAMKRLDHGKPGGLATGYDAYASFDYFGAGDFTNNASFSGMIFRVAAQNCNRVRLNEYTYSAGDPDNDTKLDGHLIGWSNFGVFTPRSDAADQKENVAYQIDLAFANNLRLNKENRNKDAMCANEAGSLVTSFALLSTPFAGGLIHVRSFSKFNVGLVWYYYNLWSFNWLLGFAGIIICASMLGNIVFGLMTRILQVVALFLVFPPLVGITPLDEGQGFTTWRKQFVADILMVIGAVVGTNIFFTVLPIFDSISFFGNSFVDGIVNILIIMAGLTLIKKFIALVSKFAGGSDANEVGQSTRSDVTSVATKAMGPVMKGLGIGMAAAKPVAGLIGQGVRKGAAAYRQRKAKTKSDVLKEKHDKHASKSHTKRAEWYGNRYNKAVRKEEKATEKQQKKTGKALGFNEEDSKKHAAELQAIAQRLNTIGRKERAEIIKKAGGDLDKLKFEVGLDPDKEKKNKNGNTTGEVWKGHQEAFVKRRNKKAKFRMAMFGQGSKFKESKVVTDQNGETQIQLGTGTWRGLGSAVFDLSKTTLKSFAQMTGAADAWKKLGEAGAVDDAKKGLQSLAEGLGIKDAAWLNDEDNFDIRTEKDRDKAQKNDLKAARNEQLAQQQAVAKNLSDVAKLLGELKSEVIKASNKPTEKDESKKEGEGEGKGGSGDTPPAK